MNTKNVNKTKSIIVPGIYVKSISKKQIRNSSVTLEKIIYIAKNIEGIDEIETIVLDYVFLSVVLAWTSQTIKAAKLIVSPVRGNTKEKTFQQTNSHGLFTKILSQSPSVKRIIALASVYDVINREFYGITADEQSDEGIKAGINNDYTDLIENKGSGTLKIRVDDAESRSVYLKGRSASIRSTLCTTPVYNPDNISPSGVSINSINKEAILEISNSISSKLLENEIIPNKPSEDIFEFIKHQILEICGDANVDDSMFGTIPDVPLDSVLGVTRIRKSDNSSTKYKSNFTEKLKIGFDKKENEN